MMIWWVPRSNDTLTQGMQQVPGNAPVGPDASAATVMRSYFVAYFRFPHNIPALMMCKTTSIRILNSDAFLPLVAPTVLVQSWFRASFLQVALSAFFLLSCLLQLPALLPHLLALLRTRIAFLRAPPKRTGQRAPPHAENGRYATAYAAHTVRP